MLGTLSKPFEIVIFSPLSGKCIFCSHPAYGGKINLDPFELICGKKIEGSWGGNIKPDKDIPKFSNLFF